jgi:hypothetical protein
VRPVHLGVCWWRDIWEYCPELWNTKRDFQGITCFHVGIDSKYRMLLTSQASSSGSSISQDGPFEN